MAKLAKKFTEKCGREKCHHGRAAHVGDARCKMKHCKCDRFK